MQASDTRSGCLGQPNEGMAASDERWPVEVCLLGGFRLLRAGTLVTGKTAGKVEALLANLALGNRYGIPRTTLVGLLWPDSDPCLASQSLNSLVYGLRRLLQQIVGAPPILSDGTYYKLNVDAGIRVDVTQFDTIAAHGDRQLRAGDDAGAAEHYANAVQLYQGDLCAIEGPGIAVERERLRARYLNLLARLGDFHLEHGDALASLQFAQALLSGDPCREDALRLVMRCYVRRGERAQALRQFKLSELMLRTEFDATPEPATLQLWDQVRLHPECV